LSSRCPPISLMIQAPPPAGSFLFLGEAECGRSTKQLRRWVEMALQQARGCASWSGCVSYSFAANRFNAFLGDQSSLSARPPIHYLNHRRGQFCF
jgi:hypothetical protein